MSNTPPTPRHIKLSRARRRNRRRFTTLRGAGLVQVGMWMPANQFEQCGQRAIALGVHKQTVVRAAVEVGLRYLTTSDVIRVERQWRGIIRLPVAPRYPGEKTDNFYTFDLKEWRRQQEKNNGKAHRKQSGPDASREPSPRSSAHRSASTLLWMGQRRAQAAPEK